MNKLAMQGRYVLEHFRNGVKIGQYEFHNAITNQGKNKLLDVCFGAVTPITLWYTGLIDSDGYTILAITDTYQNIGATGNQWSEFTTYTDGNNSDNASTRPVWGAGSAALQAITNAAPEIFDVTTAGTVVGVFTVGGIAAAQNKSDHAASGVLWATATFTAPIPVNISDQLKITYTVTA